MGGFVLLVPAEQALARIMIGLLVSIIYLIALLAARPYVHPVDDYLACGGATSLVFIFLGAMLIRNHEQISEEYGEAAAVKIMAFGDTDSLTAVVIALCLFS